MCLWPGSAASTAGDDYQVFIGDLPHNVDKEDCSLQFVLHVVACKMSVECCLIALVLAIIVLKLKFMKT